MVNSLPEKISVPDGVLVQRIDDETVLLDLDAGCYFGLDSVATDMWEALASSDSTQAARQALLDSYEVDAERLDEDLAEFVAELLSRGLLKVPDA
jgi:hypothetical protein